MARRELLSMPVDLKVKVEVVVWLNACCDEEPMSQGASVRPIDDAQFIARVIEARSVAMSVADEVLIRDSTRVDSGNSAPNAEHL